MDNLFLKIISLDNLFESWQEFKSGKRKKIDVQDFERRLEDNLFLLHSELKNRTYRHSNYTSFYITDPKLRHIHKAIVKDRIVHHAVYRVLYPIFDAGFIYDSYSCRIGKGTHKAVRRLEFFARKVSKNYTGSCFALKCDIRKFFDSVDHEVLKKIIKRKIGDDNALWLVNEIIGSYKNEIGTGMPIGNLSSQLFANIYLNKLDQFVKHILRVKYYLRYCDDFVILSEDTFYSKSICVEVGQFLKENLNLNFHPQKIIIRKLRQGIDFLGYVVLPHYIVLRTKTKRRMLKRVNSCNFDSYLGLLKHCNGYKLEQKIRERSDFVNA